MVNLNDVRNSLYELGYVVVPNCLDHSFLKELTKRSEELASKQTKFLELISLPMNDPCFWHLFTYPKSMEIMVHIGGHDPKWANTFLINKKPFEPRRNWHIDWYGWDEPISTRDIPPKLSMMYYLTPTTLENGCFECIPKSHRWLTKGYETARDCNPNPDAVPVLANPGDVLLFDARLLHSTAENKTDKNRIGLSLFYYPNFKDFSTGFRAWRAREWSNAKEQFGRYGVHFDEGDPKSIPEYKTRLWPNKNELMAL